LELAAKSHDGLSFTIQLDGSEPVMKGTELRGVKQFSPSKKFKGRVRANGEVRISWKKLVRGLRNSPFKTRVGESDWRPARNVGYLSLNMEIDEELHPEFRFKETGDVADMLREAIARTSVAKKWWEFWQ
jgi:hypothetical protein